MRASITNTYCLFQRPSYSSTQYPAAPTGGVSQPLLETDSISNYFFCLKKENRPSCTCRESWRMGVVCASFVQGFPPK